MPPTTSRPSAREGRWPPMRPSRCRRLPTLCRWWRPTRRAPLRSRPGWASGHRSRGCKRRSMRCPRRESTLLGPAHLVGALAVLEGHGHLTLGAVDADVAVETGTLFDGRVLTAVALDVFDVLRPVPVGAVGEDLLYTGLGCADVQLGGHEETRRPEAQHQHHCDDDGGEHTDHRADERPRTLRAGRGLAVRRRVLAGLAVLARLTVLARLPVLRARGPVLSGLVAVLALLRVALREGLRRWVVLRGRLLVLPVFSRRVSRRVPALLLAARRLPALVAGWLLLPG